MQQPEKVMTIAEVEKMWDNMTVMYPSFDCAPQSFYYGIINMLQLSKAKNILQVGCGRCIFVPHCLELVPRECTYLATDLSPKMIALAEQRIKNVLNKFSCSLSYEEWCVKNHLTIRVANGEEIIEKERKFDRIICNMVLMLTEDPEKMLRSLYEQAEEGCLLGVSVWGQRELNLIQEEMDRIVAELNVPTPKIRSNFHLYNKVAELGEKAGWKLVATWEQVSVFPYLKAEGLDTYAKTMTTKMLFLTEEQRKWVYEEYMRRQEDRLEKNKQALTFPSQISILRKA